MAELAKTSLLKTPLYDLAEELKARFVPFSGWLMPVQFGGLKQEHQAVRSHVGMFDISHMGKFALQGKDLIPQLQKLVPSNLARLDKGQAQYTVLLNSQGGIIDDIIFYHQGETATGETKGFLIVNAATKEKDKQWILSHLTDSEIQFQDLSSDRVLIAVQGREAVEILQPLITDNIVDLPAYGHLETQIDGNAVFIARTGYTGEDGFEVMIDPSAGKQLWHSLLASGVTPCGLGARDTLRLEAAMRLYGQDMDETTSPLEAGLGWLVHLQEKEDFIGKSVLEQQKATGIERKLVGLEMQGRYIARHDYPIISAEQQIGIVTSGTLSPTLGKAIALGYVPKSLSKVGQELEVSIRGKTHTAKVVKKPFYKRGVSN